MRTRRPLLRLAGAAAFAIVALLVFVPVTTGRPIVSYPVSGSMVPTLGPFDVFFVDPWPGPLHVGDIVVFDSVARGAPAVHRIVGGDESAWLTQGDANPNIDQLGGEPPLTRDRVLGRVITGPSGAPIVVPGLGIPLTRAKVEATRLHDALGANGALAPTLLVAGGVVLAASFLVGPRGRSRPQAAPDRATRRALRRAFPRGVLGRHVGLALLLVVLGASAWSAHQAHADVAVSMVIVRDPGAADGTRAAPPGGTLPRQLVVGSLGLLPTTIVVDPGTERTRVPQRVGHVGAWSTTTLVEQEVAGPTSGYQEDSFRVWRYPAFLPEEVTVALHDAAPGSPDLVLGGLCALVGYAWFSTLGIGHRSVARWLGFREAWR